jgi:hypothetical protein
LQAIEGLLQAVEGLCNFWRQADITPGLVTQGQHEALARALLDDREQGCGARVSVRIHRIDGKNHTDRLGGEN